MIDKSDIITCESYKGLCDYVYKNGDEPKGGLVHVNLEELPVFFEAIRGRSDKYVIVSSCSDFGVCIQNEYPVWLDLPKWARMALDPSIGYDGIHVAPRGDIGRCKATDKYSVKCYAWTAYTFPEIPDNVVHWFMTNNSISDPRVTTIPFGIKADGAQDIVDIAAETRNYEKVPETYINWVNYNLERLEYKEYYRSLSPAGFKIQDSPKPYKSYLRDLAMYASVLSPKGNGIDCYRTLETIYMGSLPVVEMSQVSYDLSELPLLIVKSMYGLRSNELYDLHKRVKAMNKPMEKAKLSYWKNKFMDIHPHKKGFYA